MGGWKRGVLKKTINKVPNKAQKNEQRKLSTLKSNVKKFVCDPSSKMSSKDFIYNNELLVNTFTFLITYMNCIIVGDLKKSKHLVNYMWLSLLPASFNEYVPNQLNAPCLSSITAHKKQKEKIIRDYLEDESRKNEIMFYWFQLQCAKVYNFKSLSRNFLWKRWRWTSYTLCYRQCYKNLVFRWG